MQFNMDNTFWSAPIHGNSTGNLNIVRYLKVYIKERLSGNSHTFCSVNSNLCYCYTLELCCEKFHCKQLLWDGSHATLVLDLKEYWYSVTGSIFSCWCSLIKKHSCFFPESFPKGKLYLPHMIANFCNKYALTY